MISRCSWTCFLLPTCNDRDLLKLLRKNVKYDGIKLPYELVLAEELPLSLLSRLRGFNGVISDSELPNCSNFRRRPMIQTLIFYFRFSPINLTSPINKKLFATDGNRRLLLFVNNTKKNQCLCSYQIHIIKKRLHKIQSHCCCLSKNLIVELELQWVMWVMCLMCVWHASNRCLSSHCLAGKTQINASILGNYRILLAMHRIELLSYIFHTDHMHHCYEKQPDMNTTIKLYGFPNTFDSVQWMQHNAAQCTMIYYVRRGCVCDIYWLRKRLVRVLILLSIAHECASEHFINQYNY